jgi:hypothetical protein
MDKNAEGKDKFLEAAQLACRLLQVPPATLTAVNYRRRMAV